MFLKVSDPKPLKRANVVLAIATLGLLSLSAVGYLAYSNLYDTEFEVKETVFSTGGRLSESLRIAFLSDIHLRNTTSQFERLDQIIERVRKEAPDLILLGGDFTGEEAAETAVFRPDLIAAIKPLAAIAPTYTVLGNHEWWTAPDWYETLTSAGISVIEGRQESISFKQGKVCLRGLGDAYTGHYKPIPFEPSCLGIPITLTHDPYAIELNDQPGLYLAGHTHCGQVRLPLLGAPWAPTQASQEYQCGVGQSEDKVWLVTAGLGTSVLNLRFGTTPSIELITLTGGENSSD